MANIVSSNCQGTGRVTITETVLDGTLDTFTYAQGKGQTLIFRNDTAGALSPIIDGDGATTVSVKGVGQVDVSAGYAVGSIAIGESVTISTESISEYLAGTIEITGGTGLDAQLLEY